mmetsp:Transcript_86134/g.252033  ORF Transcript_86134/g.252033 Transcript_86134/m.252033 type:complete len:279 (+) Transcript_86134:98-934(+)
MDDLGAEANGDGSDDDISMAWVGIAHAVCIGFFLWVVGRTCCRKASPPDAQAMAVSPEHLQPKKRVLTSYILWLCGPLANAHHFYLDRIVHGLIGMWTMNFFLLGWLLDAVLLPFYVRSYNARLTAPGAPYDNSLWRLLRLPLLLLTVLALVAVVVLYLPTGLHYVGAVDLERMAAQTEVNPYDVLGIQRGAELSEVKTAYRKASLRWHPDRNIGCGKPCEVKMAEITKAFDAIKKRRAPVEDRTWATWAEDRGADWVNIISAFTAEDRKEGQERSDL